MGYHRPTAAEIVAERADSSKPNMGLTSWKGSKVRQADIFVAKNYLLHEEIGELNRLVTMWLDYAEDQANRRKPIYMSDWREEWMISYNSIREPYWNIAATFQRRRLDDALNSSMKFSISDKLKMKTLWPSKSSSKMSKKLLPSRRRL